MKLGVKFNRKEDRDYRRTLREEKKRKVCDYILKHPEKKITHKDLAGVAGYKMNHYGDPEYKKGMNYIGRLIKTGVISYSDYPGLGRLWYVNKSEDVKVTKKVSVTGESKKETIKVKGAKKPSVSQVKSVEPEVIVKKTKDGININIRLEISLNVK